MRLGIILELVIPGLLFWRSVRSITLNPSDKIAPSHLSGSEGLLSQTKTLADWASCDWCSQLLQRAYHDNAALIEDFESFRKSTRQENCSLRDKLRRLKRKYRLLNKTYQSMKHRSKSAPDVSSEKDNNHQESNNSDTDDKNRPAEADFSYCRNVMAEQGYSCQLTNSTDLSPITMDQVLMASRPRVDLTSDSCQPFIDELTKLNLTSTNLQGNISDLRSQNNLLVTENLSLKNQTVELTSQLNRCNITNQLITQELNACQGKDGNLTAQPFNVDQQSEETPSNSGNATLYVATVQTEEQLKDQPKKLDADLAQIVSQLEANLSHCVDSKNSCTFFIADLNEELSKLRQENQSLAKELSDMKQSLSPVDPSKDKDSATSDFEVVHASTPIGGRSF